MQAVAWWQMQQGSAIQCSSPLRKVTEAAEVQPDVFLVAPARRKTTRLPQEAPEDASSPSALFHSLMIPAHRVILATRCEFFKASLQWVQGGNGGIAEAVPLMMVPEADAEVALLLQVRILPRQISWTCF